MPWLLEAERSSGLSWEGAPSSGITGVGGCGRPLAGGAGWSPEHPRTWVRWACSQCLPASPLGLLPSTETYLQLDFTYSEISRDEDVLAER